MAIPSVTGGGTPIARDQYIDQGESIDVLQVLGQGGGVLTGQTLTGIFYGSKMAQDNLTAHAGGGQANGVPITTSLTRVTTVASAGDSLTLPPAIRGMEISVVNDAATNSMNVFPASAAQGGVAGGDSINALGANAAFAMAAVNSGGAGPTIFYCFTTGTWRTK
jgi:hypothetical protein